MNNFIVEDNSLLRRRHIYCGSDTIVGVEEQIVITKDEFLACYNKWVKGEEE